MHIGQFVYHVHCSVCIPYTSLSLYTMYIVQFVYHAHCSVCIPCTLFSLYTMHIGQFVYHVHCSVCIPYTSLSLYTMYIVQFVYHAHCSVCIPCTLFSLYTMYIVQFVYHAHRSGLPHDALHLPSYYMNTFSNLVKLYNCGICMHKLSRSTLSTSIFIGTSKNGVIGMLFNAVIHRSFLMSLSLEVVVSK